MTSSTSYDEMLSAPSEQLDEHYRRTTLVLQPGDTAPSCTSTKWDLRAGENGATVQYLISAWGIEVSIVEGSVGRAYKESN